MSMKLSDHFTLHELIRSQTATRLGIDNTPDANVVQNLKYLCVTILEPLRARYGQPFTPSSGYRSVGLNTTIGGSPKSQHMTGQAVDIEIPGVSNYDLALYASNNLDYDQIILEHFNPSDPHSGWVHISTTKHNNRRECLTYNRKHGYLKGFILTHEDMINARMMRA
ncbi:Peptidase M15 [Nitrosomonas aestuarii]|uniref:Peptidase M15 n=1 Tax=Nitrosomonas aestuarii TaxID=52441 RepID=A0A1I4C3I2_9PROT|nr:D-Ala-D-Ala carboxypeptidase family metallohydrolase [Nitrosomonas aestuarii]SFK75495.1 Peptidase M15 [Nitrosomonas aestuarii]